MKSYKNNGRYSKFKEPDYKPHVVAEYVLALIVVMLVIFVLSSSESIIDILFNL